MYKSLCLAVLIFISSSNARAESDEAKQLDASVERVKNCDTDEMNRADGGLLLASWSEMSDYCEMAQNSLGHLPEIGVLRYLIKTSYLIHHDSGVDQKQTVHQLLNVVEARGLDAPDRVKSTFDLAYRVNHVTGGLVAPRDLNVFLRQSGEMAHTLSDEGLTSMASLLWEEKKKNGD